MTSRLFPLCAIQAVIRLAWLSLAINFQGAPQAIHRAKPTTKVDLKTLGYTWPTAERELRAYDFLRDAVAFIDDETSAVSFLALNAHSGASKRDGAAGGTLLIHTAFVNPKTGQVLAERSWGNAGNWNTILPLADGRFFVQDGEWIRVYQKNFVEVSKVRMEVTGDILPRFLASASGRSLYEFRDGYDRQTGWVTRLDALAPVTLEWNDSTVTLMQTDETVSDDREVYSSPKFKNQLRLLFTKRKEQRNRKIPCC
jgi:hypothetical protein